MLGLIMTGKKFDKLLKIVTTEEFTERQCEVFAKIVSSTEIGRFIGGYTKFMNIKLRKCDCDELSN
jgi:hypothetical protein